MDISIIDLPQYALNHFEYMALDHNFQLADLQKAHGNGVGVLVKKKSYLSLDK